MSWRLVDIEQDEGKQRNPTRNRVKTRTALKIFNVWSLAEKHMTLSSIHSFNVFYNYLCSRHYYGYSG